MTQVRYSATTHLGLKRKVNEDSILALPDQQIWVVADGMGDMPVGILRLRPLLIASP